MKHISAGIKIGILVLAVSVIGYYSWKMVSEQTSGRGAYRLHAMFRDASGLPGKSRVVIAGLPIGEIADRTLKGRYAEIVVRVKRDAEIWSNAGIYKKSSSLLGEYYIEIDPGTPANEDGSANVRLKDGDEIKNVFEASSADDLIRRVNQTVPRVDEALVEIKGLAQDVRKLVNGPVAHMAGTLDNTVTSDTVLVHDVLERMDHALETVQHIANDVQGITGGRDKQIDRIMDNLDGAVADIKDLVAVTKNEVSMTGGAVRDKLDHIDGALKSIEDTFGNTASVTKKIDEDQGTLGKLVNDPEIGDNVESITTDIAGFVKTAFGMQTVVGIRSEYNFLSESFKTYFSLELQTRNDKYYLVEIVDDPRGHEKFNYLLDPASGNLVRVTTVETTPRFTFQFAKRIDRFTLRVGIKESTGGVGADAGFFDNRLTMSADVFDTSFDHYPRVKFWAAYNFFRYLYIYAGVDDVLNEHQEKTIVGETVTGKALTYEYGRDVFGGFMIKFNDADLSALLFIGGAALAGAAGN